MNKQIIIIKKIDLTSINCQKDVSFKILVIIYVQT